MLKYDLAIFDLDGTLLNTIGDICGAMNTVLKRHGLLEYTQQECLKFIGKGSLYQIKSAVGIGFPDEFYLSVLDEYKKFYAENAVVLTIPFQGIPELLSRLKKVGMKIAVLSNKPDVLTQLIINKTFGDGYFDLVSGQKEGIPMKPDPTATLEIIKQLGTVPEKSVYIGDSGEDYLNAKNAGTTAINVSWGYRTSEELLASGAETIADDTETLLDILI